MRDPKAARELEAQLVRDRKLLEDLRKREEELLQHIPQKGFCAEAERNHLLCEMRVLQHSIEKNQQMLAMAKR